MTAAAQNFWLDATPLVVASKSRSRRALLAAAGIPFDCDPSSIDERALQDRMGGWSGEKVALTLARAKAVEVSNRRAGRLVLGADQTLEFKGEIFAKPADLAAAAAQLGRFSGQTHLLHSAFALARDGAVLCEKALAARMTMRVLTPELISRYIEAAGAVILDSVGAYQIEGLGVHLFEAVEGAHSTILGLPMLPLLASLRRIGSLT